MVKAWVFEFNAPLGREIPNLHDEEFVQKTFDQNIDRIVSLEEIGFEGVFFSEHHFIDALSPSPNLLVAAVAARTKTMKLGVMGTVLPFHQPWRVAEELGMLDYLTRGRLEIGVASGVPPEYLFVNVPQEDVRPMYQESVEFLDKALASPAVSHEGRFWRFDEIPIMPPTRRTTRRRKWMTIYSEGSCRYAVRRGYRVCTGFQSVENAAKAFDGYRDEAAKIGYEVTPDDIAIRRHVVVAETDAQAQDLMHDVMPADRARITAAFAPADARLRRELGHGASADVLKSGAKDAAAPARAEGEGIKLTSADPLKVSGLVAVEDEFIFGSPATVAERLIDQCRRLGAGHVLAAQNSSLTEAEANRSYRLWAQVLPILKKAELGL